MTQCRLKSRFPAPVGPEPRSSLPRSAGRKGNFIAIALLTITAPVWAADLIQLTAPLDRQVVQQNRKTGSAEVTVAGKLPDGTNVVEARAVPVGTGAATPWTAIARPANNAGSGSFDGKLNLPAGGWYQLEVRAKKGEALLGEGKVEKVGVGDVFIAAGQSNSANFGGARLKAEDDRVVYFDGKKYRPAADPLPGAFGGGGGGSPYAVLGDLLARHSKTPVCFRGSSLMFRPVIEWMPGHKCGEYANLLARVKEFGPNGVRAILWHQGESDAIAHTKPQAYADTLTAIIAALDKDAGYKVDWFVAKASYHYGAQAADFADVLAGQDLIWKSKAAFPGPNTDTLDGSFRHDRIHFNEKGQRTVAKMWFDSIAAQ